MNCTLCNHELVRIIYGYPSMDEIARARNEEIALGGCLIGAELPTHYCYGCHETHPVTHVNYED